MSKRICALMLLVLAFTFSCSLQSQVKPRDFPRLPGAILLTGYPAYCLALTTASETQVIQRGSGDTDIFAAMSRDGSVIVSVHEKMDGNPKSAPQLIFSVYSSLKKSWTDFGGRAFRVHAAVSHDGNSLAYAAEEREQNGSVHSRLHFIDIKSGVESVGPEIGRSRVAQLSWSPDGRNIVYAISETLDERGIEGSPAIKIVDLQTGKVTKIADGSEPAWSPSRDWIAYYGPKGDQIWIVHPDATGNQLLATLPPDNWPHFRGTGSFIEMPVWSPDSGRILLNENWNPDKDTFAIHIVDILTHKMTRELKDKAPVWGWAEAK